jgi:hypothetical protein
MGNAKETGSFPKPQSNGYMKKQFLRFTTTNLITRNTLKTLAFSYQDTFFLFLSKKWHDIFFCL